jgi:hypothetical protein
VNVSPLLVFGRRSSVCKGCTSLCSVDGHSEAIMQCVGTPNRKPCAVDVPVERGTASVPPGAVRLGGPRAQQQVRSKPRFDESHQEPHSFGRCRHQYTLIRLSKFGAIVGRPKCCVHTEVFPGTIAPLISACLTLLGCLLFPISQLVLFVSVAAVAAKSRVPTGRFCSGACRRPLTVTVN